MLSSFEQTEHPDPDLDFIIEIPAMSDQIRSVLKMLTKGGKVK